MAVGNAKLGDAFTTFAAPAPEKQGILSKTKAALARKIDELEERIQEGYRPETTISPAAPPGWTLLDKAGGGAVVLVGTDDGRLVTLISPSGYWKDGDFARKAKAAPEGANALAFRTQLYRHSYDGARSVEYRWSEDEGWMTGKISDVDPKSIGRMQEAENQRQFEEHLERMGAEVASIEDDSERAAKMGELLKAISRSSFNRGWKEQGFGWW